MQIRNSVLVEMTSQEEEIETEETETAEDPEMVVLSETETIEEVIVTVDLEMAAEIASLDVTTRIW
ncbi:hypothetical protein D3C86_1587260 [compost metagenome]